MAPTRASHSAPPSGKPLRGPRATLPLALPLAAVTLAFILLGRLLDRSATSVSSQDSASRPPTPTLDPLITPHPALDKSRPLGFFGDPAP